MTAGVSQAISRLFNVALVTYAVVQVSQKYHLGFWLGFLIWEAITDLLNIFWALKDR